MARQFAIWVLITLIGRTESAAPLSVDPAFLLVPEDSIVGEALPVTVCPGGVRIVSGDPERFFGILKVNNSCSTLRLQKQLDADREFEGGRGQSFSLVIAKRNARATLDIQVVDVNDNPPVFIGAPSILNIPEDFAVGSVITKIRTKDPDTGVGGFARFSVSDDRFSADRQKCALGECWTTIRLQKRLDFETQRIHELTIEAEDGDPSHNRTNNAEHTISIHVVDVQDQSPEWTTDFSQVKSVDERNHVGDVLMTLNAVDGDKMAEKKNEIRYSIEPNDFIDVDAMSGAVSLKKFSPETGELTLTVKAAESDEKSMSTTGKLRLKFGSSGVSQPVDQTKSVLCFSVIKGKIKEGEVNFVEPVIISTNQPVNPSNAKIEGHGAFSVESDEPNSLRLKVVKPDLIDYEIHKNLELKIIIPGQGECLVELDILDVNDNSPKFTNETFLFYVTENEEPGVLGIVKATDADSEEFGPISYSIIGNESEFFSVSDTGELRSLVLIDREKYDRFNVVIRATDGGGLWTDFPGKVIVKDVNDNPPIFENSTIFIEIDEEKSKFKQKILASDPDLGANGQISYTLKNLPEGFPIDVSSGILFIGKLDRDTMENDTISFTIRATDHGIPPLSSTANVTIRVNDINDNYPVFTNSRTSIVLDANISPGGVIGAVSADDGDATSPNNYVQYSTENPSFRIAENGEIIYTGSGVLSKDSTVDFTVISFDGGKPSRNATAVVIINEHKKALQSELTTEHQGNDTEKTEIKWANANMAGYSYEIVRATAKGYKDSEVKKWLAIDSKTGRITTTASLTPDMAKQIRLYISMKKGKREVPVELIINVIDADATPYFKKDLYEIPVPEDLPINSKILQVQASGENRFKYTLAMTHGPSKTLTIDSNGWIINTKNLDYEKFQRINGTVIATNENGLFARTNFSLLINDVNDNRPVFKNGSVFTVSIEETSPTESELPLPYPLATDGDSEENSRLQYSIVGDKSVFGINQNTSVIKLTGELDYETQKVHSIAVRCSDGKHEVFAAITVNVLDSNDNPPRILNSDLHQLSVSEDSAIGSVVTILSVIDIDQGGKQAVKLSANHSLFSIDESSKLIVAKELKGHAGERICSSIIANDTGIPPLSTTVPYCITVYPATYNHHSPLIVSPKQNSIHYFDENVNYEELLKIKLLDEGDMSNIVYKLDKDFKKNWEFFTVDQNGSLKSKKPFDFEKQATHELKILACRSDNCSSLHLFISVNDRNDNCPIFPKQEVKLSIVENDRGGVPKMVGRVPEALDGDYHSDNTKVCYTTDSNLFFIKDPTLPVLYTNNSFDREQTPEHRITITAYDCLLSCRDPHKPMNATISLIVKVEDVNDNFPKFAEKSFRTTVIQGHASPGSHLLALVANDSDEEKQGLKYSIKGLVRAGKQMFSLPESPIAVDDVTGEVSANEALREPMYSFTASVVDAVGHEDTSGVTISVVTYSQQAELLFDAPFDFILRNEKKIVSLLSDATSMQAVIDKCRQNANFTLVLAHFIDQHDRFVDVEKATSALMVANGTARRELRNTYGLRDVVTPVPANSRISEAIVVGVGAALIAVIALGCCLWCRQRSSYSSKLRHISKQAAHHQATLSRPAKAVNPSVFCVDAPILAGRLQAPIPPLQSTEL